jgi:hypothetical protein
MATNSIGEIMRMEKCRALGSISIGRVKHGKPEIMIKA